MFIAKAYAQGGAQAAPGADLIQLGFIVVLCAVFWFMIIRPQQKRQKEHRDLIANLGKGDEVVTSSGILGKITGLDDNYVTVRVANNVELKFQRVHVSAVLPKGTLKSVGSE